MLWAAPGEQHVLDAPPFFSCIRGKVESRILMQNPVLIKVLSIIVISSRGGGGGASTCTCISQDSASAATRIKGMDG